MGIRSGVEDSTDGQLLASLGKGDKDAMGTLYKRYERPLYAFLTKTLRDREAAAEVLNDTMLDVWRQAGRFEGKSSVSTWIYSIAYHKAVSWLRKRREVSLDEEVANAIEDQGPSPSSGLEAEDLSQAIAREMEKLSVDHRVVLQLAYFHEFSVSEIAETLDCPENTVKTRMFYARQRLKTLLEAAGIKGAAA